MSYSTFEVGRTGPSDRIGGSSEYHIDTKFSNTLSWEDIRDRFDVLAGKYKKGGRNIEFSNAGVADLVYDLNATPEERLALLQKAAAAHNHSQSSNFHSFDYYAPTIGNNRFHKSAEGAPIYIVGSKGRKAGGGTGGNYGNYGYVLDENGNVVSKSGHGDNSGSVFGGGTFEGPSLPAVGDTDGTSSTPKPAQVEAVTRAKAYKDMSKAEMNAAYDKLRTEDPAKARIEGMKMHKAFFGK